MGKKLVIHSATHKTKIAIDVCAGRDNPDNGADNQIIKNVITPKTKIAYFIFCIILQYQLPIETTSNTGSAILVFERNHMQPGTTHPRAK